MATIAFDDDGAKGFNTNTTWSHTCTGTNRLLVVCAISDGADNITAFTYNGTSMTLIDKQDCPEGRFMYLYYLINPSAGTNTISMTTTASGNTGAVSASYTGVLQSVFDASAKNTGSGTTATATVTTVADNCWLIGGFRMQAGSEVAGANTVLRVAETQSIADSGAPRSPGSNSIVVTQASNNFGWIVASFAPGPDVSTVKTLGYFDV